MQTLGLDIELLCRLKQLSTLPHHNLVHLLGGIAQRGDGCIIREHFNDCISDFDFHVHTSFHKLVGKANDFGCELFTLCFDNSVIDGIREACNHTTNNADNNADYHSHILM